MSSTGSLRPEVESRRASVSIGAILGESAATLLANLAPFLLIMAICYSPLIIYRVHFVATLDRTPVSQLESRFLEFYVVSGFALLLLPVVAAGGVTFGVIQQLRGRHASFEECVAAGLGRLGPVLATGLLATFWIAAGFFMLFGPGLIAMTFYYVAVPVAVLEGSGARASLARSRELVSGNGWRIFALAALIGVASYAVQELETRLFLDDSSLESALASFRTLAFVDTVQGLIFGAFQATTAAVAYWHLRREKEGTDLDVLGRVFD